MVRRYLILLADLKDNSMIHGNVQDTELKNILFRVQDMEIQPILGTKLYKKLLDDIEAYDNGNGTPIPANYKILLEGYVIPALIPYVEYSCIPFLTTKIKAKSVGSNNDEFLTVADKQGQANLQDQYKPACIHYRNILIDYLRVNIDLFDEYLDRTNGNIFPESKEASTEDSFMFVSGPVQGYCDKGERGYKIGDT